MASPRTTSPLSSRAFRTGATSARFRVRGRGMVGWSINEYKSQFFNPQAVSSYADLATFKALMSMGAYCRKVAKSRLNKKSTQYQSVAEMPPALQEAYKARRAAWHRRGGNPAYEPKLFWKASPAGKPPYKRVGYLQKHLYFGRLKNSRSVIVGPAWLPSKSSGVATIPETHEYGRPNIGYLPKSTKRGVVRYPQREYMGLAQRLTLSQPMSKWFKDPVKRSKYPGRPLSGSYAAIAAAYAKR